jgi:hypothetical protein
MKRERLELPVLGMNDGLRGAKFFFGAGARKDSRHALSRRCNQLGDGDVNAKKESW